MVTVVGGTNIDVVGYPSRTLVDRDSNPGIVRVTSGGVGRNVAENLARLGARVSLLSVFGDDEASRRMVAELERLGIDTSPSIVRTGTGSSVYLAVMDEAGRLVAAVSDMEGIERVDVAWIDRQAEKIAASELCVVDANLPEETIAHLLRTFPELPFVLDPVSVAKAARARRSVGRFRAIKPNLREAAVLAGLSIASDAEIERAAEALHARGTRQLFISLGERGLYFSDGERRGVAVAPRVELSGVSGAGDAETAAIAIGLLRGLPVDESAALAVAAAAITVGARESASVDLTPEAVEGLAARVSIERHVGRSR